MRASAAIRPGGSRGVQGENRQQQHAPHGGENTVTAFVSNARVLKRRFLLDIPQCSRRRRMLLSGTNARISMPQQHRASGLNASPPSLSSMPSAAVSLIQIGRTDMGLTVAVLLIGTVLGLWFEVLILVAAVLFASVAIGIGGFR